MKIRYSIFIAFGVAALLAAGCKSSNTTVYNSAPDQTQQQSSDQASTTPVATDTSIQDPDMMSATSSTPTLLATSTSALGSFVLADTGMTLYSYAQDAANTSNCYDSCATAWPPYIVAPTTSLAAGAGVNGVIATTQRKDGSLQVTYNGKPLYFWKKDMKVGDTTGQNIGGVWFVVKP